MPPHFIGHHPWVVDEQEHSSPADLHHCYRQKNSTLEGQASLLYTEYYKNVSYMVATFDWINNVFNCYYFVPNGPNN